MSLQEQLDELKNRDLSGKTIFGMPNVILSPREQAEARAVSSERVRKWQNAEAKKLNRLDSLDL